MSTGAGKESTESRGATAWNDGVHSVNGGGSADGGITETQGVSAGPGGAQRGDAGAVTQASWFEPVTDDSGCKDGICPVPWLTKEKAPVLQEDVVNHPSHYVDGGIECIEAIEAQLSPEEFEGYLRGCCIKYQWRWRNKGGVQDLEKCRWYLDRLIQAQKSLLH
jgi:hypothetical protein